MTYYSGKDGTLTLSGSVVAKVSSWSFGAKVDALETTALSDSDRSYVPGLRDFSGSASIWYYKQTNADSAPKAALSRIVKSSSVDENDITSISLGWGPNSISGSCLITSAELSSSVGEVMQARISFQFTGTPSNVTL
jgi:hypothetical protein